MTDRLALVVLAAGAGKRMKSALPKPLHPVGGIPMVERVIRVAQQLDPVSTTVVVSPILEDLQTRLTLSENVRIAVQNPPQGTGHAVRCGLSDDTDADLLLVLYADTPLLTPATLRNLVDEAKQSKALVTMLTCFVDDAAGYGRIDRDERGQAQRIVERADDDPSRRVGKTEINSGMMVLRLPWASDALARLQPSPASGEYYLTDVVAEAVASAQLGEPWTVSTVHAELTEVQGVNDRVELSRAEAIIRDRIRHRHMLNGVSIPAPETVFIDDDVEIGQDTTILPFTLLRGATTIGQGCTIGPSATLTNATVGDRTVITSSTIINSRLGEGSDVGPYAHLRGGTSVGNRVHVGNFAEMKNAAIDDDVKVGHVSYLGDVHIGSRSNIGAGTITCNFDGTHKHRTEIGSDVFIGSDTMLVAPVSIESGAATGAGAVVTSNVVAGETVVGVPARPIKRRTNENQ